MSSLKASLRTNFTLGATAFMYITVCSTCCVSQHMFGSHAFPVLPSHPPLSCQDTSPPTFPRRVFAIHAQIPETCSCVYDPKLEKLRLTSEPLTQHAVTLLWTYAQSQLNITHLITSLPWNCFSGFIAFCVLMCVHASYACIAGLCNATFARANQIQLFTFLKKKCQYGVQWIIIHFIFQGWIYS